MSNVDYKIQNISFKIRKIRELKGLTREAFCEKLNENVEYWGLIERGEQAISLPKLIQVCETYNIPIENIINLDFQNSPDTTILKSDINNLISSCNARQLEIIKKFISEIAITI